MRVLEACRETPPDVHECHQPDDIKKCDDKTEKCDDKTERCDDKTEKCDVKAEKCDDEVKTCDDKTENCDDKIKTCDDKTEKCDDTCNSSSVKFDEKIKECGGNLKRFEERFVYSIYDQIAGHFNHTRYKAWPGVKSFLAALPVGSIVVDVGCGNGKYLSCGDQITVVGADRCEHLLQLSRHQHNAADVWVADCRRIGIRDNIADAVLSIAVIHHLPTEHERVMALKELLRCTKAGGLVLVYVWAFKHVEGSIGARHFESQNVMVPWQRQPESKWSKSGEKGTVVTFERFYHVFTQDEVVRVVELLGDSVKLLSVNFEANNWAFCMQKH